MHGLIIDMSYKNTCMYICGYTNSMLHVFYVLGPPSRGECMAILMAGVLGWEHSLGFNP